MERFQRITLLRGFMQKEEAKDKELAELKATLEKVKKESITLI